MRGEQHVLLICQCLKWRGGGGGVSPPGLARDLKEISVWYFRWKIHSVLMQIQPLSLSPPCPQWCKFVLIWEHYWGLLNRKYRSKSVLIEPCSTYSCIVHLICVHITLACILDVICPYNLEYVYLWYSCSHPWDGNFKPDFLHFPLKLMIASRRSVHQNKLSCPQKTTLTSGFCTNWVKKTC